MRHEVEGIPLEVDRLEDGRVRIRFPVDGVRMIEIIRAVGEHFSQSSWNCMPGESATFIITPPEDGTSDEFVELCEWSQDGTAENVVALTKKKFADAVRVTQPNGNEPGRVYVRPEKQKEVAEFIQMLMP